MRTTALSFFFILLPTISFAAPKKEVSYYPNHQLAFERFYQKGHKVGRHRMWYPSGKLRSESDFSAPDQMKRYREWYENGVLAKEIIFANGLETETKIYRESGQIYVNRVMHNGRLYGLPGGKACDRVREEK
jgi:antitoxin component YwqK of YwqJK toxin-antitoxin module